MKILFLSRWFPYPVNNGSRLRVYNMLRFLGARHEVHLISFAEGEPHSADLLHMQEHCASVITVPWREYESTRLSALLGFFSRRPRSFVDTYSAEMNNRVRQAYESVEPDVVIGSQINMAPYVVSLHGVTRILDELETGYLYGQLTQATTSLTRLRATLTWWKIVRYYRELLDALDGYTTVSEIEQRLARDLIKSRTPGVVISNGVEMPRLGDEFPAPERDTLIYCGSPTFSANLDAVRYFTSEILPLVAAERPNVRLYVTGEVPTRKDSLPQFENRVIYTGNLAAVRPLLASCWVSVVPLLKGGGTRLKILESLAVGTPVVSTSKGMEGLALKAEDDLLCADSPADFATSVIRVLENDSLRNELVMRGKEAVAARYQWSEIFCAFERFVIERNSA